MPDVPRGGTFELKGVAMMHHPPRPSVTAWQLVLLLCVAFVLYAALLIALIH